MPERVFILIENSNSFNQIFIPLARQFQSRILVNKFEASLSTNIDVKSGRKVIFGAHNAPEKWEQMTTENDIIINLEPLYDKEFEKRNSSYIKLLNKRVVYDYDKENLKFLTERARFFPLPPLIPAINKEKKKEISFVGAITGDRHEKIQRLKRSDVNVDIGFNIFGEQLTSYINQSKFFLSLNKLGVNRFNRFRFCLCVATNTIFFGDSGIFSENPEIAPLIDQALFENFDDAVQEFLDLRSNNEAQKNLLLVQKNIADIYQNNFNRFIDEQVSEGIYCL